MYMDRDFDQGADLSPSAQGLTQDLELATLFGAMAVEDKFLLEVVKKAVLTSLDGPETILYRQQILGDCLERSAIVREMYAIAVEAIEREKKVWSWGHYSEGILHRSVDVIKQFMDLLKRLRHIADAHGPGFRSKGFTTLFRMLARELDDEYLGGVEDHLRRLAFRDGILMSAELDHGNKGTRYVLRKPWNPKQSWMERLQTWGEQLFLRDRTIYEYQIADRDESGFRALSELRGRGIGLVAGALGQSTDHLLSFFRMLQSELGFYIGCLNLRDRLAGKGEPICFPEPFAVGKAILSGRGLYDLCLSLSVEERVVGNDVTADDKLLVMITGANRGGKSTFLRCIGLAQLMMQCGMFVPAESFRANVCDGIFTHYKREEDSSMKSGKLDEKLRRWPVWWELWQAW
jgi:hypothetical protein